MLYRTSTALLLLSLAAPLAAQTPSAAAGKALFESRCLYCHDERGTGTVMLGHRLGQDKALIGKRRDLTPAYVTAVIRNGVGSMPPYRRSEITDEELQSLAAWLSGEGDD